MHATVTVIVGLNSIEMTFCTLIPDGKRAIGIIWNVGMNWSHFDVWTAGLSTEQLFYLIYLKHHFTYFLLVYTWASARETLDFINIVTSPWGRRLGFPLLCLGNFLNTNTHTHTHAKFWYSLKALLSPFGNKSSKVGILWYFAAETIFLSSFSIFSDNIWSVVVNSWKTIRNIIPLPSQ